MKFERGFKTYANQIALEVRRELDLGATAPLCPWSLAESLSIPVIHLQSLNDGASALSGHVDYLRLRQPQVFSAITVFDGSRRLIVHNDGHALVRQRSDIAHELAHALLQHTPHPPFCSNGDRMYDSRLETEAGWLGPVLLVPNEAARWAAMRRLDEIDAADFFGVSIDLMRFRLRMSGANNMGRYTSAGY